MATTTLWRADEVELVALPLIKEHHTHLLRDDVTIWYLWQDPPTKSKGTVTLGKASKVSGREAQLIWLVRHDDPSEDPLDFFVITIAHGPWQKLTPEARRALVDHELKHCLVEDPEDPDMPRVLSLRPHDVNEFADILKRRGFWRPGDDLFAEAAAVAVADPLGDQPDLFEVGR